MEAIPDCHSLWIGDRLGALERACLRSFLRVGHSFTLWCYAKPAGVPEGVLIRDASEILSPDRIIRHHRGSVSLFSNWFRYELQRRSFGLWVDCDVYALQPIRLSSGHCYAWAAHDHIGTAVLRIPSDSPLLPPLLEIFEESRVPSWLPLRARVAAWLRLWLSGRSGLSRMPWGVAGPLALTHLSRAHGLDCHALPSELFYPVHWDRARWILDPRLLLDEMVTPRTRAIHLWNELIKDVKEIPAPRGSFLARLQAEGAD